MSTTYDPNRQKVIFQPHPGKQTLIFTTSCDQILAGGGKKSGKTACAIARPLPHVVDSRFRCVIIRRTIPGLKYIESQARKLYRRLYGDKVEHNKTQHLFTFPSGAQILFTFAETLDDCEKLEGWGYQMLIVDEARQFPDALLIDTLSAELYAENDEQTGEPWMRPILLLLSNPGGRGGEWLRERFAIDKFPKGGSEIYDPVTKRYRIYIHMTVHDNPSMEADSYISGLRIYPVWKQKQMIDGDWFQKEGSAFEEFDPTIHVIKSFDPGTWEIHRSCDWGYATICAVHYWAVHPDYNATVCIDELTFSRVKPRDVARSCLKLEESRGYEVERAVIGDDAGGDDTTGLSPYAMMAEEGVYFRKVRYRREDGYRATVARLATMITLHDGTQIPSVRFVEDRCPRLWQSIAVLPQKVGEDDVDKAETKKADGGKGNDHWWDSCFISSTCVDTADGMATLESLIGTEPMVYSADGKLHRARNVRLTRRMAETVVVRLVDGREVRCTPDHRFATTRGWVEASALTGHCILDVSHCVMYNSGHESIGDLEDDPGVQRGPLLPLRTENDEQRTRLLQEVREAHGHAAPPRGVGARAWTGPERLPRPSQEPRQNGQSTPQPRADDVQRPQQAPLRGRHGGENREASPACCPGGASVARDTGWTGLALQEWQGRVEEENARGAQLHGVRAEVQDAMPGLVAVLHVNVQPESTVGAQGTTDEGLVVPLSALAAEVASVVPSTPTDVYCLTVPDTGCFSVAGGLIVSNCKMHFCSLPLPESEPESVERFRGVPDEQDERSPRGSSHQGMRGF